MKDTQDSGMLITVVLLVGIGFGMAIHNAIIKGKDPIKKHQKEMVKYNKKHKAAFR